MKVWNREPVVLLSKMQENLVFKWLWYMEPEIINKLESKWTKMEPKWNLQNV